jgi:hypothetical protein
MIKIREEKTDDMFLILSDDYHIPYGWQRLQYLRD